MVVDPSDYTKILHNISMYIYLTRRISITSQQNIDRSAKIFKTFRKILNIPQNTALFLRNIVSSHFPYFCTNTKFSKYCAKFLSA